MKPSTETVILNSFLTLLSKRPPNKITVKDIVEDCGFNRNTFYYHFAGIPELLERLMKLGADHIMSNYRSVPSLEACLSNVMTLAQEYRRAILSIYQSNYRELYERYLLEICGRLAADYVDSPHSDSQLSAEDRAAIVQAYKCECFGQIINWMNGNMRAELQNRFLRSIALRQGSTEQLFQSNAI